MVFEVSSLFIYCVIDGEVSDVLSKLIILYLLCMNLGGFLLMGWDKRKARKEQWRVPEERFFLVALLGGSVGCWLGMQKFRHKTKKKRFTIGMPAIFVLQILAGTLLCGRLAGLY